VSRQPDFASTPRRERAPLGEALLLAAALAAAALGAGAAVRARRESADAAARVAQARQMLEEQRSRGRAATASGLQPAPVPAQAPPSRIVEAIGEVLPGDARLVHLRVDYRREIDLAMRVDARSAEAWDRLLARLEGVSRFREVEPGPEAREAEVRTTLRARYVVDRP
jgi:hypothetical protein